MNENLLKRIKNRLNAKFYVMNDAWLRDCIEFFVRDKASREITDKHILDFVESQWLLSDLREISNEKGCLPKNLAHQVHTTLSGVYILQVDKIYDIASSKYKQLCEIRRINNDNLEMTEKEKLTEWEPKARRMMQLCLTDGVQHIIAIEYTPLKQMTNILLPGYKVMITGPITCRRGIILLENGKYKEIGGEVDRLLKPNALENVLARALGEPENFDPYHDNGLPRNQSGQNIQLSNSALENSFFDDDFEQAVDLEAVRAIEQRSQGMIETTQNRSINTRKQRQGAQIEARNEMQEEFLEDIDFEPLDDPPVRPLHALPALAIGTERFEKEDNIMIVEEASTSVHNSRDKLSPNFFQNKNKTTEFPDDDLDLDDVEFTGINNDVTMKTNKCTSTGTSATLNEKSTSKTNTLVEQTLKVKTATDLVLLSSPAKVYDVISDVLRETITGTIYRMVRGKVKSHSGLTKQGKCWTVTAEITDDTANMKVCFDSQILEKFLGFTVQEFSQKKKLAKLYSQVDNELRLSLRKAQHRIENLDALLKLELTEDQMPKIVNIA